MGPLWVFCVAWKGPLRFCGLWPWVYRVPQILSCIMIWVVQSSGRSLLAVLRASQTVSSLYFRVFNVDRVFYWVDLFMDPGFPSRALLCKKMIIVTHFTFQCLNVPAPLLYLILPCVYRTLKAKRDAYVGHLNRIYRNNLDRVSFFLFFCGLP